MISVNNTVIKTTARGVATARPGQNFDFIPWYSKSNSGIRGQSSRVMLNGGLSPLRFDRKKVKNSNLHLNLISAGQSSSTSAAASFLKRLPAKNLLLARSLSTSQAPAAASTDLISRRQLNLSSSLRNDEASLPASVVGSSGGAVSGAGGSAISGVDGRKVAFSYRSQLGNAKRIVIKLGSAVITNSDGNGLALGRLACIVEQVAELQNEGRECILITSGAVAYGKQRLVQEILLSMSMRQTLQQSSSSGGAGNWRENMNELMKSALKKPNAAVGQSGLQALYETMFRNYGLMVGQVLVTKPDFYHEDTRRQLFTTIEELLQLNIIPIVNTNDAVSPPASFNVADYQEDDGLVIKDNDSLAALMGVETGSDLVLLMSDVDGIYDRPPSAKASGGGDAARLMHTFNPRDLAKIEFGAKSETGTGGMESKVKSALWALERGSSVVISNGMQNNSIRQVMAGQKIGSFFTNAVADTQPVEVLAKNARTGSRRLQSLTPAERSSVIQHIADSLLRRSSEIIRTNQLDLDQARKDGVSGALYDRLVVTEAKLQSLSAGLRQIAETSQGNVGRVLRRTRVSQTMDLVQRTVPIGVLMVIFESRPDALPQVACLAIATANGLMMKGGKEAQRTNGLLMEIVKEALANMGCGDAISMVSTREAIGDLLKMDKYIDLVIPRGSGELVRAIKDQSQHIPVLGHAEGVCHVYVDKAADRAKALDIVLDSKLDYPAACNAMETLLLHEDVVNDHDFFEKIMRSLKERGVAMFSGPRLSEHVTFAPPPADAMNKEYGDKACAVEMVSDVRQAVEHVHKHGSAHTDVIVTEDEDVARTFVEGVDSACVFANCSSRMADGYRLGLGAEVGISTGRIHARGPVGAEGLLTTKWMLYGDGDTAADYAQGKKVFVHESLPLAADDVVPAAAQSADAAEELN